MCLQAPWRQNAQLDTQTALGPGCSLKDPVSGVKQKLVRLEKYTLDARGEKKAFGSEVYRVFLFLIFRRKLQGL